MTNYNYDSVHLVPRVLSDIDTRDNCDTSIEVFGLTLKLPLITAPMDKVCNGEMAIAMARQDCLGIIHCKQSIESQLSQFDIAYHHGMNRRVACAIGITKDYEERFINLVKAGCRIFCLDTANGFNSQVEKAYKNCYHKFPYITDDRIYFIAGNVASKEGYEYLANLNVDAVRVGIAGGSVCETKTETGVHAPTLFSVQECNSVRVFREYRKNFAPLIIADGGIRTPGDMAKAIVLGADLVMAGNIFAGCDEAPGEIEFDHSVAYKMYRGSASFATQTAVTGRKPFYVEGREMRVPAVGSVVDVLDRFKAGLRSSMSYHNALTLKQYRETAKESLFFT